MSSDSDFHAAYLGKRLQDLLDLAHAQMQQVYHARGLDFPVQGSSTLQAIEPGSRKSLSELSEQLGQSHQLIAQRLRKLEKRELIYGRPDHGDRRKTLYSLTEEGERKWKLLNETMELAGRMNEELFAEIDADLVVLLERAIARLQVRQMSDRMAKLECSPTEKEFP